MENIIDEKKKIQDEYLNDCREFNEVILKFCSKWHEYLAGFQVTKVTESARFSINPVHTRLFT